MDTDKLGPDWAHLFLTDRRTPEERAAAESKEWARRKGRGRKDWWKTPPLPLVQRADDPEHPSGLGITSGSGGPEGV